MKTICKFATLSLVTSVFASLCPAQAPRNLVAGVSGQVTSDANWAGNSALSLIPGAALFPITSTNTVLYLGFTAGSTADVGNMVIYTTKRASTKITKVTPVTLGGVSNPSIDLASTSVCPVPPSTTNPCTIRLDPTVLSLSPLADYYFVVFFTNDTNNKTVGGADPGNTRSSLSGLTIVGDETRLKVGQAVPGPTTHVMDFLLYVMTS
jgi:hypothetical protein